MRRAGGHREQLAVSLDRRAPVAGMPVEECLVDRATAEPVDRGRRRLTAVDVDGPEPAPVPGGDGEQVPVQGRVIEVVEADRGRELDE